LHTLLKAPLIAKRIALADACSLKLNSEQALRLRQECVAETYVVSLAEEEAKSGGKGSMKVSRGAMNAHAFAKASARVCGIMEGRIIELECKKNAAERKGS